MYFATLNNYKTPNNLTHSYVTQSNKQNYSNFFFQGNKMKKQILWSTYSALLLQILYSCQLNYGIKKV